MLNIVVGGIAENAKTVVFHLLNRVALGPALIFHSVNSTERPGAVQTGPAMDQHGMISRIIHDFQKAIDAGMAIIHISTELRVAYKNGLKLSLQEEPDEVAPYKIMKRSVQEMLKVATERLKLFNKIS